MTAPIRHISEVRDLVLVHYGLQGDISPLGSCQDLNYKLVCGDGSEFVFKILNSSWIFEDLEFQFAALVHLSQYYDLSGTPNIIVPVPVKVLHSEDKVMIMVDIHGSKHFICLLTYIKGKILSSYKHMSKRSLQQFGVIMGDVCSAFSTFGGTGHDRDLQWDLRKALTVIQSLLPEVIGSVAIDAASLLRKTVHEASVALALYSEALREQVIHGDLACYNIVAQTDVLNRPTIRGIIDFGDTMVSWTVAELAVGVVSSLEHVFDTDELILQCCAILKGFHSSYPLIEAEVMALWPLLQLRSVVNILSIQKELEADPGNEYNLKGIAMEWRILRMLSQVEVSLAQEALRSTSGLPPSDPCVAAALAMHPSSDSDAGFVVDNPPPLLDSRDFLSSFIATSESASTMSFSFSDLDLSPSSALYTQGNWLLPATVGATLGLTERIHAAVEACRPTVAVIRYGRAQLHYTRELSLCPPHTISLGVQAFLPAGTEIAAPFTCNLRVESGEGFTCIALEGELVTLYLRGLSLLTTITILLQSGGIAGPVLCPGQKFAAVTGPVSDDTTSECSHHIKLPPYLHVQACAVRDGPVPPTMCSADMFPFWSTLCPNPESLLLDGWGKSYKDFSDDRRKSAAELRTVHVAGVQEHYYVDPPEMVRGWREFMYDSHGRAYLDMVNNVTVLGHCHPAVTSAMSRQVDVLNTNSRFVYTLLGEYADKIVSSLPANTGLDCVLFVNSGSEATDLALRMSRAIVTARRQRMMPNEPVVLCRDVICLEGAYHGVTTASDEVSTTLNDNPNSRGSRPPWVHLVPMPNSYRGNCPHDLHSEIECSDVVEAYVECVEREIELLEKNNTPLAAFIAEPLSGNAGGVELPTSYLSHVYSCVRRAGGLCICDEVQVGYGRLGGSFWGFQEHDVIPDILTMAKAAGNGFPLGFVVTRRELAEEFGVEGSFFSSAAGSPVGCAVGIAVLDAIVEDELQKNAAEVGAYIHEKLRHLASAHPVVGYIHGHGLYQGIELVKAGTKEPNTDLAYHVCERLLSLGVICHNTGDYSNVLKVKPPLCITKKSADFFILALQYALS